MLREKVFFSGPASAGSMLSIGSTVEAAAVALLDAAALAALASFFFGFLSGPFFLCALARSDVQLLTPNNGVHL